MNRRILRGPAYKPARLGYLDDIEYKAKTTPGFQEVNYKLVLPKTKAHVIHPPVESKETTISRVGPATYDYEASFTNSQIAKPKFFMSNSKQPTYIAAQIKQAKQLPGVGQYNWTRAEKVMTKGFSRGWK